ncbi:MAG: hypothetical protein HN738_02580 [Gammaproteobacteria bacterium]|jgi:hypothetical protein|nr:hypothetical protein [Gammaproteobacteria bacterium]
MKQPNIIATDFSDISSTQLCGQDASLVWDADTASGKLTLTGSEPFDVGTQHLLLNFFFDKKGEDLCDDLRKMIARESGGFSCLLLQHESGISLPAKMESCLMMPGPEKIRYRVEYFVCIILDGEEIESEDHMLEILHPRSLEEMYG